MALSRSEARGSSCCVVAGNRRAFGMGRCALALKSSAGVGGAGGRGGFLGLRPTATLAQYPGEGLGICSLLQRLAMATSEIPNSAASLTAGADQMRSYSSSREYSESGRVLLI